MAFLARLMAFFATPSGPLPGERPAPQAWAQGSGYLGVVGESQYQPALQRVARTGRLCWATLLLEPNNPFDGNSVAVQIQKETVGYLCRVDARRSQKRLLIAPMRAKCEQFEPVRDR
jgi:hypothetical protein